MLVLEVGVVSWCSEDNDETTMPARRSGDEGMTRAKTTGRRVRNAQQQAWKAPKASVKQVQVASGDMRLA